MSTIDKKHNFMVSEEHIEMVNNYTYLGVHEIFCQWKSYKSQRKLIKITEKTKRSFFAARRYLDFLKLPIHIINKLFNTVFFPILTYCSEVWGIYDKFKVILAAGIKTPLRKRIYIFVKCV